MKTTAAVFTGPGSPLELVEIDVADPGPGEVVVRMAAVGICGTDLHSIRGEWMRPTPMVLGHEGAGVIEHVGADVRGLAVGDEVVLSWAPSCQACADCARGRPAACVPLHRAIGAGTLVDGSTGLSLEGETVYRGTATGALAERIVVDARVALPTGGRVPLQQAALLGCAALTGFGAVTYAARVPAGATVLIIGAGGVGLFGVQAARIAGASAIVSVDPLRERLALATTLGATHVAQPDELAELLARIAPEGVDYSFDAVGDPETTALALSHSRSSGTTVIVGLPAAGRRLDLDPAEFIRREKLLTGTMYGSEDPAVALPVLLGHVHSGALQLEPLLGSTFPLTAINDAFAASLAGTAGRVVVTMT